MTRPKPKKPPVALAPHTDPSHPEYISPREEHRLRRELLQRIDHLFIIADAKGYGPLPSSPDLIEGPTDAQTAKQHPHQIE